MKLNIFRIFFDSMKKKSITLTDYHLVLDPDHGESIEKS